MFDVSGMQNLMGRFGDAITCHQSALNALNVFPVADADTGTNMRATLDVINAELAAASDLADVRHRVERAALQGRGNSGLILGQYLAGFADRQDLHQAATAARAAVAKPVEGTMLSVADAITRVEEGARLAAATQAVDRTPEQLPVLAQAGVVDSGAAGVWLFVALLEGAEADLPTRWTEQAQTSSASAADTEVVGHEIQFLCSSTIISAADLRALLETMGTDVVVGSSNGELSAHVHVQDDASGLHAIRDALGSAADQIEFRVEPLLVSRAAR